MSIRHRFWLLLALRWLPTGLVVPVAFLLPLERGLSLAQLGTAVAAQGVVVLVMEIPSGALTDTWGRRPVVIASAVTAATAYSLAMTAQSMAMFTAAWAVMGLFRALDSGPLEAWFVDSEHDRGAGEEVPSALAAAGGVMAGAIATGSLTSAALVHSSPWRPAVTLAVPYAVALVVVGVQAAAALVVMNRAPRRTDASGTVWVGAIAHGARLALGPAMRVLTLSMVFVGIGVMALELFMPVRLGDLTGDASSAGAAMGLISATAWAAGSVGAALTSRVLRHHQAAPVAIALLTIEAVGLLIMALAVQPPTLVVGFWAAYLVHTGFGSTFNSLVHARVDNTHRGTALSMTSMAFLGSAAAGSTALGLLADKTTPSVSLGVGVGCLLIAAALIATSTPRRKNAAKSRLSRANARNRDTNPVIAEQPVDTHGIRIQ